MNLGFWEQLGLAALIIVGVWNAFQPGMILGKAGDWMYRTFPEGVRKPLVGCPPCMASVHGTWVFLITGGDWHWLPVMVIALSGLMKIVAATILSR